MTRSPQQAIQQRSAALRMGPTGLMLAACLLLATPARTQASAARTNPGSVAAASHGAAVEGGESGSKASSRKPGVEGIKVHGHWKIDVRNADGTLARSYEFENSLVSPNAADVALSQILSGQATIAGWAIELGSSTPTALCVTQYLSTTINTCALVPKTTPVDLINTSECASDLCYAGLTATIIPYNSTTQAPAAFQLQESFTVPNGGPITNVATVMFGCGANSGTTTVSVDSCLNYPNESPGGSVVVPGNTLLDTHFTATSLPTPLMVASGQIVQVTVTISFS
jgi:hypothetical protein